MVTTEESLIDRKLSLQIALRTVAGLGAVALFLFIPAGRLDYWQGWVYLGLSLAVLLVTRWVLRGNPQLIEERLKPGAGIKTWDKWYFALSTPLYLVMLVVAGLDAGRFAWTGWVPVWIYILSIAVYLLGQAVFLWAKRVNNFFATVVRIQTERGQTVCKDGPYHYLRHPGYLGGILFGVSSPLMLGSLWALIPAVLAAVLLLIRTALEDRTLQAELTGYTAYTREVRYRLLPGVW
jgi:protein-S-isoprenylcysteine O-methyltransferase Ste14